jgi:DNA-directed RNA polymerase specialized sigma24 family protein
MPTPSQPQHRPVTATELFARYHQLLRRNVRAVVNTSDENVEDACMFAWTKFLSWELEDIEVAYSWLTTVAIREAVKLDRRSRRTYPLVTEEDEVIDPKDQLQLTRLLAEVGDVVRAAGLSPRQTHILGLQVLGLGYNEIVGQTRDTKRTIERQIVHARRKLARALSER